MTTPLDAAAGADLAARSAVAAQLSLVLTDATEPDEPLVWINDGFSRLTGYTPAEVLGRNCRFLQGPGTDAATVARLSRDLAAGRTATETLLNYHRDGTPFWNRMVISPVRDADGRITHHLGIQTDATDDVISERARVAELELLQQSSQRLDLLARVGDALTELLEFDAAADAVAEITVPALASWGFIALLDRRGGFGRVHVAVTDPADRATADELERGDLGWVTGSDRVMAALRTAPDDILLPQAVDLRDVERWMSPTQRALIERLGLGSSLVVPLWARDRVLGVLTLAHRRPDGFDLSTVVTAAHLGRRAGLALDNVRLYAAERSSALALQHRLLPRTAPVPGLDVAASYLPSGHRAEVGGDWYDVLPLPDGGIGLTVGDVVGHDMVAAASMGQVSSLLRAHAWTGAPAGEVLGRLTAMLRQSDTTDIATCVYVRWRPAGGSARLEYANAGHPPPLLRLPDGRVHVLDGALSLPVGLADGERPTPQARAEVPPGAVLVLYTDGLVERRDRGLREGLVALRRALADAPADSAVQVRDHLLAALVSARPEDDVCLLVVRCHGGTSDGAGPAGPRTGSS